MSGPDILYSHHPEERAGLEIAKAPPAGHSCCGQCPCTQESEAGGLRILGQLWIHYNNLFHQNVRECRGVREEGK